MSCIWQSRPPLPCRKGRLQRDGITGRTTPTSEATCPVRARPRQSASGRDGGWWRGASLTRREPHWRSLVWWWPSVLAGCRASACLRLQSSHRCPAPTCARSSSIRDQQPLRTPRCVLRPPVLPTHTYTLTDDSKYLGLNIQRPQFHGKLRLLACPTYSSHICTSDKVDS